MLDDFFTRALIAGFGMALVTGPLGCFIVWRRMAYYGDTLAHAALLGVALAFLFEINVTLAVFAVAACRSRYWRLNAGLACRQMRCWESYHIPHWR